MLLFTHLITRLLPKSLQNLCFKQFLGWFRTHLGILNLILITNVLEKRLKIPAFVLLIVQYAAKALGIVGKLATYFEDLVSAAAGGLG